MIYPRLKAALLALAAGIGLYLVAPTPAVANQTATPSYCVTNGALSGLLLDQAGSTIENGMGCVLQPGDIYTDGPIYPATFTFSGSSFAFTIPAMVWISLGNRSYSASTAETAPASTTSYWYLECNLCSGVTNATWETNTTGTPPDAFAVLMYTVVTNGSGITGVTFPTPAGVLFNAVSATSLSLNGSSLTGCDICDGATNTVTTAFAKFGDPNPLGYTTLGTTNSVITWGTFSLPGSGLAITNSANGLVDVFDAAGSFGSAGDIRATHSMASLRSMVGGYATATAITSSNYGDLEGSRSVSTGNLNLGGTTTSGNLDFGITTAGTFTSDTQFNDLGAIVAGSATGAGISGVSGGDLVASRSNKTGALYVGGTGGVLPSSCLLDYGVTNGNQFTVGCTLRGSIQTFSGLGTFGNLKNTGLSSATVLPLCGASGTNESQCAQQSTLFATTGNVNVATGTTANTYQQLGSNVSVTTGTSTGANGNWLVKVEMPVSVPNNAGTQVYGCITSASTFTLKDGSTDGASNCVTAKTNSFAGDPAFGFNAVSAPGLSQMITATLTVANSTTFTMSCFVAGSTTTSTTVYGSCRATAVPY